MELESAAVTFNAGRNRPQSKTQSKIGTTEGYSFDLIESFREDLPYYEVDMKNCIREIVDELKQGVFPGEISNRFHIALVNAFVAAADRVGGDTGIKKAVLSGGVFNNDFVLNHTILGLEKKGFTVFTHSKVPTGDGGIALGQVLVAAAQAGVKTKLNQGKI